MAKTITLPEQGKYPKPLCPKCGTFMYDNIHQKKNPKQPDLKCSNKECDFAYWGFNPDSSLKAAGSAKAKTATKKAPQRKEEDDDLPF